MTEKELEARRFKLQAFCLAQMEVVNKRLREFLESISGAEDLDKILADMPGKFNKWWCEEPDSEEDLEVMGDLYYKVVGRGRQLRGH
jgi:hypothetical protein